MQMALLAWMRVITPAGRRLRPKANQAAGMSIVQDVQIPIAVQQEIH
jgi:hypothetical protein